MYAVVRTGGKQYKVAPGDVVLVEKLDGEAGAEIKLDDILMVNDGTTTVIGSPTVEGAVVTASIIEQGRADKILVFKKKRRQGYRRMAGHRQDQTVLRILDVAGAGAKKKKAAAKKPAAKKAPAKATEKKLSAIDAAAQVLGESKDPLNTKEMVEAMSAKKYWTSPGGKTPHATLYSAILREIQKKGDDARFQKVERGRFTLTTKR